MIHPATEQFARVAVLVLVSVVTVIATARALQPPVAVYKIVII